VAAFGYPFGYPISVGSKIQVTTGWSGTCEEKDLTAFVAPMHGTRGIVHCDEQEYSLRIECVDDTVDVLSAAKTPCEMRDGGGSVHLNRIEVATTRGTQAFEIKLVGKQQASIVVTLRRGGRTYVYQTPRLHLVVPDEFVVECQFGKDGNLQKRETVPCDAQEIPGAKSPWILVRSPTAVPLGEIRVNGVSASDAQAFPLGQVLPRQAVGALSKIAPGDYQISVEVNPPPDTIRRNLTIRIR